MRGSARRRARLLAGTGSVTFVLLATMVEPALAAVPTITSFSPSSGPAGCVVTITGTNFTNPLVSSVDFNGTQASVASVTSTQIRATVPNGATTGPIHVVNTSGTATSTNFTVSNPGSCAPTISSFTPTAGSVGTSVSITGTNFGGADSVTFNNVASNFSVNAAGTQVTTTVPTGATTGPIRVTTDVGTATSATNFTVPTAGAPAISSFSPTSGPVGTSVTVNGTNFTGVSSVTFNNVVATFSITNSTKLRATVPSGATTGPIRVTNPSGSATSVTNFTVTTSGLEHERAVTLRLSKHIRARGAVRTLDGTTSCEANRTVKLQRRRGDGTWKTVERVATTQFGDYSTHLPDRTGTYRARAIKEILATGEVCLPDASPRVRHRH